MKREVIHFEVDRPRSRAHRVLFSDDSPFKPKSVRRKDQYRRRDKHPKRSQDL